MKGGMKILNIASLDSSWGERCFIGMFWGGTTEAQVLCDWMHRAYICLNIYIYAYVYIFGTKRTFNTEEGL